MRPQSHGQTMSFKTTTSRKNRFVWAALWCGLVLSGWLSPLSCTPIAVQLDPEWSKRNSDGSASISPDQESGTLNKDTLAPERPERKPKDNIEKEAPKPEIQEKRVESPPTEKTLREDSPSEQPPIQCTKASAQQLQLVPMISPNRGALLVGDLGSQAAKKGLRIQGPTGWKLSPSQVSANSKGEFAFVIHRQGSLMAGGEKITISSPNQWCYFIKPQGSNSNSQTKIKDLHPQTCKEGTTPTLTFALLGKPKEKFLGYTSNPGLAEITKITTPSAPGKPTLKIKITCKRSGSLSLMVGGRDLEASLFTLTVTP